MAQLLQLEARKERLRKVQYLPTYYGKHGSWWSDALWSQLPSAEAATEWQLPTEAGNCMLSAEGKNYRNAVPESSPSIVPIYGCIAAMFNPASQHFLDSARIRCISQVA